MKAKKVLNKQETKKVRDVVNALSMDNVVSVYTGRPGCCCGCRGNHRHNTKFQTGDRVQSYSVFNDRQCRKVIKMLKTWVMLDELLGMFDVQNDYIAFQTESHLYVAYTGE